MKKEFEHERNDEERNQRVYVLSVRQKLYENYSNKKQKLREFIVIKVEYFFLHKNE